MDRASLEQLLGQGLSLAEIGRRFGRHESTVAYWAEKHGLQAVNHGKHAARGGLARGELGPLVAAGMSIAQIAETVGRSKATVRHWLLRYDLKTKHGRGRRPSEAAKAAKGAGLATATMHCPRHGDAEFALDGRGYTAASNAAPPRWLVGVERSRRSWSARPADAVASADTAATCAPCTFTTSTRHGSDTRSTPRGLRSR